MFANISHVPQFSTQFKRKQVFMNFWKSHYLVLEYLVPKHLALEIWHDCAWVTQALHKTSALNLLKLLLNELKFYDLDPSHQYVLL